MTAPLPEIGAWYRIGQGETFEVVACDADDGTIEIQYFDGTVEELDIEDWEIHLDENRVESVEPPEDWSGSVDVDTEEERPTNASAEDYDGSRGMWASGLDDLDMFE